MNKSAKDALVTIYALCDPRDERVRYVGMTTSPGQRLVGHLRDRGNEKKWAWVEELRGLGLKPDLKPLAEVAEDVAAAEEHWWIRFYLDEGEPLCNLAKRGPTYIVSEDRKSVV